MDMSVFKANVKRFLRGTCAAAAPAFPKVSKLDPADARKNLEVCWDKKDTTCFAKNNVRTPVCDLQIVVPAYNVEAYLEECMDSILNQKSRFTFHVVLVDDGAKDGTPAICDKYTEDPRVTVIHQKNRGLSGARNTGMEYLFGRYVLFVDSDDRLAEGAIEGMMNTACANHADLVEGGAYYLIDGKESVAHRYEQDQKVTNPYKQLHGHAWGKLFQAKLLEKICFPEGYWYEDSVISMMLFSMAENIWVSSQMCSGYRINQDGIVKSSKGKPRAIETYWLMEILLKERRQLGLPMDAAFFNFLLLQLRLNQLRLKDLDEGVQESAFVLSCDLLERNFALERMAGKEKNLIKALRRRDFGMFKMCCRFF
jgi:glycosyltransferase involved in cell wall biosynthesis